MFVADEHCSRAVGGPHTAGILQLTQLTDAGSIRYTTSDLNETIPYSGIDTSVADYKPTTIWHLTGGAVRAPRSGGGVLDEEFRPHGIRGLRVADLSSIDTTAMVNTMPLSLMTGRIAASVTLKGSPPLPSTPLWAGKRFACDNVDTIAQRMVLAFDTSRVRVAITPVGRNDSIRLSMPYEATGRYTLFISHALGVPDMGAVHKMRLSTLSFSDSFDATFLHANPQYFDQAGDIINSVPDSLQTLQRCELLLE